MYYFAYASNLNRKQMAERVPDSKPKFIATLPNFKLVFTREASRGRDGVATIRPQKGEKVMVAVYEISGNDLKRLDRCERKTPVPATEVYRMGLLYQTRNTAKASR